MVLHLVLLRFKPGTTPERIARAGEGLRSMQQRIPEIRRISWGANLGPSSGEYSHVLAVTLDDVAAVKRYLDHPAHLAAVAEHLSEIREARLAVDLEW
ncbi:MAG: Dabb family protein [Gemmatimonadales bacterium]